MSRKPIVQFLSWSTLVLIATISSCLETLCAESIPSPPKELIEGKFGAEKKNGTPSVKVGAKEKPSSQKQPAEKKYPYHGNLESVDAGNGTIRLKGRIKPRVIMVDSNTLVTRSGRKVNLNDAVAGEKVSGSVMKVDGKEKAVTLRLKGEERAPVGARPSHPSRQDRLSNSRP